MPLLQLVASEGKWVDGPIRFRCLWSGDESNLLPTSTHMPEAHSSQSGSNASQNGVAETVVVLTIKHKGQLPADLLEKLTKRVYDYAAIGGIQPEVTAKEWYALEVKEA